MTRALLLALLLATPAVVVAQAKEHPPEDLKSSAGMKQDKPKSESWTYARPGMQPRKYGSVLVEPTAVYAGADAEFDDVKVEDRQKYAAIVTEALRTEIGKSFPIVTAPRPDTVRLRVTLLGAETTKGGLATVTRVTPIGFAANAVRSLAGKEGRLTGSLLVAVEFFDGTSRELEFAAVRRRSPDALDIPATLSTSDTVKAVADDLAKDIRVKLDKAAGRPG